MSSDLWGPDPMRLCVLCAEYPPGPHGGDRDALPNPGAAPRRGRPRGPRDRGVPARLPGAGLRGGRGRPRVAAARGGGGGSGGSARGAASTAGCGRGSRAGAVDLVEAPDSRGWFALWPRQPVPLVLRSSGSNTYFAHELGRPVNRLTHQMERDSYRRADAWIAQTRHAAALTRDLFGLAPPDLIVPNVVDPPGRGCRRSRPRHHPPASCSRGRSPRRRASSRSSTRWPSVVAAVPGRDALTCTGRTRSGRGAGRCAPTWRGGCRPRSARASCSTATSGGASCSRRSRPRGRPSSRRTPRRSGTWPSRRWRGGARRSTRAGASAPTSSPTASTACSSTPTGRTRSRAPCSGCSPTTTRRGGWAGRGGRTCSAATRPGRSSPPTLALYERLIADRQSRERR